MFLKNLISLVFTIEGAKEHIANIQGFSSFIS